MNLNVLISSKHMEKNIKWIQVQYSLVRLHERVFEKPEPFVFNLLAAFEVSVEERAEDGYEIAVIVLEALREPAALVIELPELKKEGVIEAREATMEKHPEHIVVHKELQPVAENDPGRGRIGVRIDVPDDRLDLRLPRAVILLHHFVGEEREGHDAAHAAPVVAVHREHHVLAFSSEDVEDNVACPGPELYTLGVEDFFGELRGRDHDEVALAHAEEEDVSVALGQRGQKALVEVVAHLEPVAHHGEGPRARREVEVPRGPEEPRGSGRQRQ